MGSIGAQRRWRSSGSASNALAEHTDYKALVCIFFRGK
jgi:hypothetical protein